MAPSNLKENSYYPKILSTLSLVLSCLIRSKFTVKGKLIMIAWRPQVKKREKVVCSQAFSTEYIQQNDSS